MGFVMSPVDVFLALKEYGVLGMDGDYKPSRMLYGAAFQAEEVLGLQVTYFSKSGL